MDGASGRRASATTPTTPRATARSQPSGKTIPSSTRRSSGWCLSSARSAGSDEPPVGAARHQGLRLDHRRASRRRRRRLSRPRRGRRGQFPQPVSAGRRQGPSARRLDHGRPDRSLGQGHGQERPDRHDLGQRHGRHLGRSGLEGLRQALPGTPTPPKSASRPRPPGGGLLRFDDGDYEALDK